ncbi:MAG: FtsQ-type POTRA domain-containing protein [Eubacterium sp.]|nr:FtsQ-type POTRA domain-containing protein [Eubacterium sp.]
MKKSQKKRTKKASKPIKGNEQSFNDLGIEPPKIYRESQRTVYSDSANRERRQPGRKADNLTHAEKRQKDNKKRKKRNKFRKVLIWLMIIIAFAATGTVLSLTVFFHIDTIEVIGDTNYELNEILAQCTIDKGENLFLSDTQTAKQMLEQNLPYIYNAEIKRKLPYTIEIQITTAQPAYSIMNKDKTYILLDDRFKVLEESAEKSRGITIQKAEIESAAAGMRIIFKDSDVGDCLSKLAKTVNDNSFSEITAIYCNNINDNYVVYDGRIEFKLGTCDNLEKKIYQGLTACAELNNSNPNATGTMTITGDKSLYFTEK